MAVTLKGRVHSGEQEDVRRSQIGIVGRLVKRCDVTRGQVLEINLPLCAMIVMNNVPVHPLDLEDDLTKEFKFIKSQLLLHITTP